MTYITDESLVFAILNKNPRIRKKQPNRKKIWEHFEQVFPVEKYK